LHVFNTAGRGGIFVLVLNLRFVLKFIYNEKESHRAKAVWDKGKGKNHMKQKIFLTSIAAIMLVAPAFATVGETNFNTNQTGVSSCEIGVLGVDENTANANAQWSTNSYTCPAGTYLPDGDTWSSDSQYGNNNCAACTSGSYCGGGTLQYSEANDVGITACPTGYTNSAANATAQSECYRTCAAADVPHLKSGGTMTGGYYYGDNNQCGPANDQQCASGYHYMAGFNPATDLPDIATDPDDAQYVSHMGSDGSTSNTDNDLTAGEWKTSWTSGNGTKGTLKGIASCNTIEGTYASSTGSSASMTNGVTGQYCWCKTTSWTPSGGTELRVSSAWVFNYDYGRGGNCANYCAGGCAGNVGYDSGFRPAVFAAVGASPAQCAANTITLNWGGYGANNDQSQQTTCTYGGTIDTPTTAPTKRGHTFTGWRFVAPSGN